MTTCALVGASDFNSQHFQAMLTSGAFDAVIAVDGGYAHLQHIDCKPTLALGDFDSLGFTPQDVPVRQFNPRKDESDMALALESAVGEGCSIFYIYGALGKRLDHTLANFSLFSLYSEKGCEVTAIDEDSVIRFLTGPAEFTLPELPQGTVSVFSMSDISTGVTERGLEYELENHTLTNRTSLGLSNELINKPATISVNTGTLAVFYPL